MVTNPPKPLPYYQHQVKGKLKNRRVELRTFEGFKAQLASTGKVPGVTILTMKKWAPYTLLAAVLILAAFLRMSNLDWDNYNHYHPDERYISWVATSIEWPETFDGSLDPRTSTFNPFYWPSNATSPGIVLEQDKQRRFAYGHLPLYLGVAATRLMEDLEPYIGDYIPESWSGLQDVLNTVERNEYRHITATGRALTSLVDTLTVLLVFILGRQLFGVWPGVLAATFAAFTVLLIQLAHFFTVDSYLTFFVLLTVTFLSYAMEEYSVDGRRYLFILLAAGAIGLSIGSKFTGLMLVIPLAVTVIFQKGWSPLKRVLVFSGGLTIAFVVFAITNPFAILDFTCDTTSPAFLGPFAIPKQFLGSCYLQNIGLQATMVQGLRDVPFVRQYSGTLPILYFIEMQIRWGMGLVLGIVAFAALVWEIWRGGIKGIDWWRSRKSKEPVTDTRTTWRKFDRRYPFSPREIMVLSWTIPFFISTGLLSVKFMRYIAPLIPFLLIYSAALLLNIRRPVLRYSLIFLTFITTASYAFAFQNIYNQPHPWVSASRWIYENIESGSTISTEAWDDQLPDTIILSEYELPNPHYEFNEINWLSGTEDQDDLKKIRQNLSMLGSSDYVVLASNRNYGVIPRLSERYPYSSQYYEHLFNGDLGFEVIYVSSRMPNLLGVYLKPDSFKWPGLTTPSEVDRYLDRYSGVNLGRFDESFTVYDQPMVIILENKADLSIEEMLDLFDGPNT